MNPEKALLIDRLSMGARSIPPSGIRRFFDLIARTEGVISLGVGEPDFATPWHIREAGIYSIEQGYTTYTSNRGLPELREAISRYLEKRYGVEYDPSTEILVTVGVSQGIDLALRAILNPGDEVLIPEPCFVSYAPCTVLAGGVPVYVPLEHDSGFTLGPKELVKRLTPRSKALLLSYPNNPTGSTLSRRQLEEIAAIVRENDMLVVSDEIYSELTYDGEHACFSSLPGMKDRTVLLNGFSKAFAMTGWRIGFAAAPEEIADVMVKIHQYTAMCAPTLAQKAAVEALGNGETEMQRMVWEYRRRRNLMVAGLRSLGLPCTEPSGAFYVFPSIRPTGLGSAEFAEMLLQQEKVAVVPGTAFGPSGEGFIRCSYATSLENLKEALRRMERFISRVAPGQRKGDGFDSEGGGMVFGP